jgi:hypothetical protein
MKTLAPPVSLWLVCWLPNIIQAQPPQLSSAKSANSYYAGNENPLVMLGAKRVVTTINYPDWFLWPAMSKDVRQQLVDSYTTREFLLSFDQSATNAPATKYNNALQLIFDLLSAYGGNDSSLNPSPTQSEVNQALKQNVVPKLVKPRDGYEQDSPSANETDYAGLNGDEIKTLDKEIRYLARRYNIPTGYKPPAAKQASKPAGEAPSPVVAPRPAPKPNTCPDYCAGQGGFLCGMMCGRF